MLVFGSRVFNKSEYATKCVPNPHNSIYSELTTQNCDDKSRFGIDFTTRQEFKCDPFLISIILLLSIKDIIVLIKNLCIFNLLQAQKIVKFSKLIFLENVVFKLLNSSMKLLSLHWKCIPKSKTSNNIHF